MREYRLANLSFIKDKISEFTVNNFNAVTTSILSLITQININIKNISANKTNITTVQNRSTLSAIYTKRVNTSDPANAGEWTLDTGTNTIKIYESTKNGYTLDLTDVKRLEILTSSSIWSAFSGFTVTYASNVYTITYTTLTSFGSISDGFSGIMTFNWN